MKIRPSTTQDGKIEGAILALTDIEALLRSQENRQSLESSLYAPCSGSRRICYSRFRRRASPCW